MARFLRTVESSTSQWKNRRNRLSPLLSFACFVSFMTLSFLCRTSWLLISKNRVSEKMRDYQVDVHYHSLLRSAEGKTNRAVISMHVIITNSLRENDSKRREYGRGRTRMRHLRLMKCSAVWGSRIGEAARSYAHLVPLRIHLYA